MNTRAFLSKIFYCCAAVIILTVRGLLIGSGAIDSNDYLYNSIFLFLIILISVILVVKHNKCLNEKCTKIDIFSSFALSSIFVGLYMAHHCRLFGLTDLNGFIIFMFGTMLYFIFLREVAYVISPKENSTQTNISRSSIYNKKQFLDADSKKFLSVLIKAISIFLLVMVVFFSIVLILIGKIDAF